MKSAIVEREVGDAVEERRLLAEGLEKFPSSWKMWLMLGQLEEARGDADAARTAYTKGCRRCHDAIPLWTAAATLEQRSGFPAKARAILEQARTRNPKNEWLWLAATRQERAADPSGVDPEAIKAADALLSKGLQECPASGALWAEAVKMAPRPQRKAKSVDALKRCDNDPRIIASIANLFWQDRKVDKARSWFNRACTIDPDFGDHWAAYYRFELQHGGDAAADAWVDAVARDWRSAALEPVEEALCAFADRLTATPAAMRYHDARRKAAVAYCSHSRQSGALRSRCRRLTPMLGSRAMTKTAPSTTPTRSQVRRRGSHQQRGRQRTLNLPRSRMPTLVSSRTAKWATTRAANRGAIQAATFRRPYSCEAV